LNLLHSVAGRMVHQLVSNSIVICILQLLDILLLITSMVCVQCVCACVYVPDDNF